MKSHSFAVLDFGSQYTQLIARRLREIGVYSEIFPYDISIEELKSFEPSGIILSGGPSSVGEPGSPQRKVKPLTDIAPILGICYGMQLIAKDLGGRVHTAKVREYGLNHVNWEEHLGRDVHRDRTDALFGEDERRVPRAAAGVERPRIWRVVPKRLGGLPPRRHAEQAAGSTFDERLR